MSESFNEPIPVEPKTKQELFLENPDNFENLDDVLFVIKRDKVTGHPLVLNKCMTSIDNDMVLARAHSSCNQREMYMQAIAAKNQAIITPGNNGHKPGFLNGIRNMGRK